MIQLFDYQDKCSWIESWSLDNRCFNSSLNHFSVITVLKVSTATQSHRHTRWLELSISLFSAVLYWWAMTENTQSLKMATEDWTVTHDVIMIPWVFLVAEAPDSPGGTRLAAKAEWGEKIQDCDVLFFFFFFYRNVIKLWKYKLLKP